MNIWDQEKLTDLWQQQTRSLNDHIDDEFKKAQDAAYQLGLERGKKDELKAHDEIERLKKELKASNAQAEYFEREWYLRGDLLERAEGVARNACEGWNDALMNEGAGIAADAIRGLLMPNK